VNCYVVAGFLLTSASRGPSAIAEPLVFQHVQTALVNLQTIPGDIFLVTTE